MAFCSGGGPTPLGTASFTLVSGPSWAAKLMGRALAWESGGHVLRTGSESYCMTLDLWQMALVLPSPRAL